MDNNIVVTEKDKRIEELTVETKKARELLQEWVDWWLLVPSAYSGNDIAQKSKELLDA